MLEFFLNSSVRYHVDFIAPIFQLDTLSYIDINIKDSLATNKQANERKDDQCSVFSDSMSKKRKSFERKYHAFFCPQMSIKLLFSH